MEFSPRFPQRFSTYLTARFCSHLLDFFTYCSPRLLDLYHIFFTSVFTSLVAPARERSSGEPMARLGRGEGRAHPRMNVCQLRAAMAPLPSSWLPFLHILHIHHNRLLYSLRQSTTSRPQGHSSAKRCLPLGCFRPKNIDMYINSRTNDNILCRAKM